jgi:uncharacterized glyoxalase superfamily protein PhnB/catechol 2,3-dioxygenase-like lactoylglutathione lyase family enzyme
MTTDPFESLAEPPVPLAPRPAFAADLRRRVVAALGLTGDTKRPDKGAPVLEVREYTPARLHALTPYLSCLHAGEAIAWYQDVFDAQLLGEPIIMEDGRVGHAELRVGDSVFMLAGEFPEESHLSPETLGGSTVSLMLHVPDCDATFARALERGATQLRAIDVAYGARRGTLRDPFGHRWFIATATEPDDVPVEDAPGRRYGDIGYMTLEVPDGDRARTFYEKVFGWNALPSGEPGSFHVASITPPSGIHGRPGDPEFRLYFRVDDIQSAVDRILEAGGEVLSTAIHDSGGNAECRDDQGLRFDLFRPRAGY